MKKIISGLLLIVAVGLQVEAASQFNFPQNWDQIQVSSSASPVAIGTPQQVNIAGSNISNVGLRNCITELTWSGDAFPATGQTLAVLDQGTTVFQLTVTTYTAGPFIESWPSTHPLCLSMNATSYVQVSTGNFKVNVSGYRRDF